MDSRTWIILRRQHPGPFFLSRIREPHKGLQTSATKLSLRLLPAIFIDNEDDDDGNFTKWMSSYWGHGGMEEHAKKRKMSFRWPLRNKADRRASLPCMSQLGAMQLNQLHTNTMPPAAIPVKTREEKEVHSHPRARRVSSDENSRAKVGPECHITTIPELSESLEKRLRFHNKKVKPMGDADSICLICHEVLWKERGSVQKLHCAHHFHKEAKWPEHGARPRSRSSAAACDRGKEVPFCPGQEEYRLPSRHLSLNRQR
ncbi:uncharacterized protein LOC127448787 [Myxocyprinus asiaticus]|uniref:uncharacterized protein LOC127448787 n=1 Tax=Myxocyprinus asiaticus TaxID=70543 RepID=UPI0022220F74|nr:uncharacterized protein LOC127448787 [Myxocyprinus asiaticus]